MKRRMGLAALITVAALGTGADLFACGDKFLVGGRGTRYQRPKNFRTASILIYANPSTGLEAAFRKLPVESVLKREGHRSTKVEAPEQLSAILASGRFDVVLAGSGDATVIQRLLGEGPDTPIMVVVCPKPLGKEQPAESGASCALKAPPKAHMLLDAIDKAVERRDRTARKAQSHL